MNENIGNNKTVAKNTLFLYGRQLFSLVVSIITAGITLNVLGVTDYGIHNVVGGIIGSVSFLTRTLSAGAQRFLAYDMVRDDKKVLNHTFCSITMTCYIMGAVVFLILETAGVWFLNTHMIIPKDRLYAANWVLQFSIFQFVLGATTAPFMSVVIARERMGVFAYVGVIEVVLRLLILYLIIISPLDKLITLSFLGFFVSSGIRVYYQWYCNRHFEESHLHLIWDKKLLKEILSFSGWSVLSVFADTCRRDGTNVLINMFFNPAINAARGIANQINMAVMSFAQNFMTAVNPQITKTYSASYYERMHSLIFMSSRLSFYLFLVLCIPLVLNIDQILVLWLRNPPEYTSIFVIFVIINSLVEILSYSLNAGVVATGIIKFFHIAISSLYLLILPVSYVFLSWGYPAVSTLWINSVIVLLSYLPRLYFCKKLFGLSVKAYLLDVMLRTFLVGIICFAICYYINEYIADGESLFRLFLASMMTFVVSIVIVYIVGIKQSERGVVHQMVNNFFTPLR